MATRSGKVYLPSIDDLELDEFSMFPPPPPEKGSRGKVNGNSRKNGVPYRMVFIPESDYTKTSEVLETAGKKMDIGNTDIIDTSIKMHIAASKMQMTKKGKLKEFYQRKQFKQTSSNAVMGYDITGNVIKKKKINPNVFKPIGVVSRDKVIRERWKKQPKRTKKLLRESYKINNNMEQKNTFTYPNLYNQEYYSHSIIRSLQLIEFRISCRMSPYQSRVVNRKSCIYVDMDPNTFFILQDIWCRDFKPDYINKGKFLQDFGLNKIRISRYTLVWKGKNGHYGFPRLQNKEWWIREEKCALGRIYRSRVLNLSFEFELEFNKLWILFEYEIMMWTGQNWQKQEIIKRSVVNRERFELEM